jgi:predicted DsbA family dithiol-disulfide isomerase
MKRLSIDVWSDIACPWCYVGKRRLEAALARFPHRDQVDVTWRAFELDPSAPKERDPQISPAQRLANKYGMPVEQAKARMDQLIATARADGLDLKLHATRSGNTFDGHRLVHLATKHGKGDAAKERLFRAYFTDGENVADEAVLLRIAKELALDEAEVRDMLDGRAFTNEVRGDEAEAQALGIRGVPCFVVDRRYGVSGAQPAESLLEVLNQAWSELAAETTDGAVCGPEGCA